MKLTEAAREVIRLAEASGAYWARELPKRHPSYPLISAGEDSGPPPPEELQLREFLEQLPEEQVFALTLLMYIGRGDYGVDHLAESYQAVKETFETAEFAIAQMMGKSDVGDYLAEGLAELGNHGIHADRIDFVPAAVPTRS